MIRLSEQMRGEICGITEETLVDNEKISIEKVETRRAAALHKMSWEVPQLWQNLVAQPGNLNKSLATGRYKELYLKYILVNLLRCKPSTVFVLYNISFIEIQLKTVVYLSPLLSRSVPPKAPWVSSIF